MTKFKVGDKVRVKSLDWYQYEYRDKEGRISFSSQMSKFCDNVVTIETIVCDSYTIKEDNYEIKWIWQDYMFEDEVVKEDNDIIKNIKVVESFKIKKGDNFQCIKDVVMCDGVIDYKKGKFYTSDCDGCITDDQNNEGHYWTGDDDPSEYFIKVDSTNDKHNDNVNHPKHYTPHPSGVECIEITSHFDFCIGSVIQNLWWSGLKKEQGSSSKEKELEDLKKARFYLDYKIKMLESEM